MDMQSYRVPIHRSLTERLLIGGVPREFAILNGTFTGAIVLGMHVWWWVLPAIAIHAGALLITRRDPLFMEVIRRLIHQKELYDA